MTRRRSHRDEKLGPRALWETARAPDARPPQLQRPAETACQSVRTAKHCAAVTSSNGMASVVRQNLHHHAQPQRLATAQVVTYRAVGTTLGRDSTGRTNHSQVST